MCCLAGWMTQEQRQQEQKKVAESDPEEDTAVAGNVPEIEIPAEDSALVIADR